jgi:hypothetical protein
MCHSGQVRAGIVRLSYRNRVRACTPKVVSKIREQHKGGCFSPDPSRFFKEPETKKPVVKVDVSVSDEQEQTQAPAPSKSDNKLTVTACIL